jgi:hypothetical protein
VPPKLHRAFCSGINYQPTSQNPEALLMIAFRSMPFQIPDDIFQPFFVLCSDDKMDVTRHDAIAKYFQPFVFLTVFNGLDKNFAVLFPCEKIDPVKDGKRYKVRMMLCT